MILHALIFALYLATCPEGTIPACIKHQARHTEIYNDKWKASGNGYHYFYHSETFGIDIAKNPCAPVNLKSFLRELNKDRCYGTWCKNGQFGQCGTGGRECYQMEHIYDKKGCDYTEKEANIWANVVMAYGKWNSQVSHTQIGGCINSFNEKREIYGAEKMAKIKNQIDNCKKIKNKRRDDEPITDDSDEPINEFNYSTECDVSCTCESNRYLDILCGCDYSETDFNPDLCTHQLPIINTDILSWTLAITSLIFLSVSVLLITKAMYFYRKYCVNHKTDPLSEQIDI